MKPSCSLYIADAVGRHPRKLARVGWSYGTESSAPAWSPDGKSLAVVIQRGPANDEGVLHVMSTDGKSDRTLGTGNDPAWSPDGKRLTFNRCSKKQRCVVRKQLVATVSDGRERVLDAKFGGTAAWSPDGKSIAYFTVSEGYGGCGYIGEHLLVAPADGGKAVRVAANGDFSGPPIWLPDGSRLLIGDDSASVRDPDCHIPVEAVWLVKPDGKSRHQVMRQGRPLALSPDAKHILITHWKSGKTTLSIVGIDGSGEHRLPEVRNGSVWRAAWSPDGNHVAYEVQADEDESWTILTNASGSSQRRIAGAQFPTWGSS